MLGLWFIDVTPNIPQDFSCPLIPAISWDRWSRWNYIYGVVESVLFFPEAIVFVEDSFYLPNEVHLLFLRGEGAFGGAADLDDFFFLESEFDWVWFLNFDVHDNN